MPTLDPRRVVHRRFSFARLATGAAAVGISAGILVVLVGRGHFHAGTDDFAAVAVALVAGPIGLSVLVQPFAEWCIPCGRRLEPSGLRLVPQSIAPATAALQAGDVRFALQIASLDPHQGKWVTVWFCPQCRSTVVWKGAGARVVATGGEPMVALLEGKA